MNTSSRLPRVPLGRVLGKGSAAHRHHAASDPNRSNDRKGRLNCERRNYAAPCRFTASAWTTSGTPGRIDNRMPTIRACSAVNGLSVISTLIDPLADRTGPDTSPLGFPRSLYKLTVTTSGLEPPTF